MTKNGIVFDVVQEERRAFADRLRQALTIAGYGDLGPAAVARLYNHHCPAKVSHHAVLKWLKGESMPVQHRLICLADWLQCDSQWLRYGTGTSASEALPRSAKEDSLLLRDLSKLGDDEKQLIAVLVSAMLSRTKH